MKRTFSVAVGGFANGNVFRSFEGVQVPQVHGLTDAQELEVAESRGVPLPRVEAVVMGPLRMW